MLVIDIQELDSQPVPPTLLCKLMDHIPNPSPIIERFTPRDTAGEILETDTVS
jgi:hypothetical protein